MKPRGLLIATVVLAALAGTLYWSNHHQPKPENTAISTESPKMLTLKEGNITQIEIKKKTGDDIALQKSDGKWQITAPEKLAADQDAVSGMLSTLSSLDSERVVEDKTSNLEQYGLAQPSLEIDLTEAGNQAHKILLGDDTPTGNSVFAMIAGDPRVFTLASYNKTSIDKSLNDLRDKRLLNADFDKVTQIQLHAKNQDIEFGRDKQGWQILKPRPLRTEGFQVDDLINKLKDAKMDLGAGFDEKKAAAAFASATPVATVKVTDAAGTQDLQVRKSKDDFYAKSSNVAGVYKVSNDLGQGLDKKLDDFRNKKLFDFGYDEPNKIEMHDGTKSYLLTKSGEDWSLDGKKMDSDSVTALVDKLRFLAASKFVESGFATPVLDVTVTSNDNKRVEKVLISKSGENYIAKRDGEPSLYALDAASVTDLQKAAAGLKPAAPPPAATPAKK